MKIQIVSDLHLEFAPIKPINNGAEVLILAGDILVAQYFTRSITSPKRQLAEQWLQFLTDCSNEFNHVLYVMGNHEHYHGRFALTAGIMREATKHLSNFHVLDNDFIEIDGEVFYGSTLWTDFNRGEYAAKVCVQNGLNDYRLIEGRDYRPIKPEDTLRYHQQTLVGIDIVSRKFDSVIFIGHHAPSFRSIEEQYRSSGLLNYGYYSDLENFIMEHQNIKLWAHGHVHSTHDYMIGDTRVIANPRGYAKPSGENENKDFDFGRIFNV